MKTWSIPAARTQQFAANEYVSACYNVWCVTPGDNSPFGILVADSNGNGAYDAGADQVIYNPQDYGEATWLAGCGGKHDVRLEGDLPGNNGFVIPSAVFPNCSTQPVYFWYGDVIGENVQPENNFVANLHITDLSRADAFTDVSNKS